MLYVFHRMSTCCLQLRDGISRVRVAASSKAEMSLQRSRSYILRTASNLFRPMAERDGARTLCSPVSHFSRGPDTNTIRFGVLFGHTRLRPVSSYQVLIAPTMRQAVAVPGCETSRLAHEQCLLRTTLYSPAQHACLDAGRLWMMTVRVRGAMLILLRTECGAEGYVRLGWSDRAQ